MGGFFGQGAGGIGRGGFFGASPAAPSHGWIEDTPAAQLSNSLFLGVGYGAGKFLIVESNGGVSGFDARVHVSTDLVNWTDIDLPFPGGFVDVGPVAYGNGTYVIVGGSHNALVTSKGYWSTDAATWHIVDLPDPQQGNPYLIAFGAGIFLVLNAAGTSYMTSPDGQTWTLQNAYSPPQGGWFGTQLWFDGTRFITGTIDAGGNSILATTTDGIHWTESAPLAFFGGDQPAGIASSPTQYVVGQEVFFTTLGLRGPDVNHMTTTTDIWLGETQDANQIAYGGGRFVSVGSNSDAVAAVSSTDDGATWSFDPTPPGYTLPSNNLVTFGGGNFLSVGLNPNYAMYRTP